MYPTLSPWGIRMRYVAHVKDLISTLQQEKHVLTSNPEYVMLARKDAQWRECLMRHVSIFDGNGMRWLWRYHHLREQLWLPLFAWLYALVSLLWNRKWPHEPDIIHGSDILHHLMTYSDTIVRLYLLGGESDHAHKAAMRLTGYHPKIHIVGYSHGPTFSREQVGDDIHRSFIEEINAAQPDALLIGFGSPKQDEWIAHWLPSLPSLRWAMGVGGSFSFWSASTPRAPQVMRTIGCEWLWRLITQPWRWCRILTALSIVFGDHYAIYHSAKPDSN